MTRPSGARLQTLHSAQSPRSILRCMAFTEYPVLHAAALRSVLASCNHAIPTSRGACEFALTRLLPVLGKTLNPCAESRLRAPSCDTLPQNAPWPMHHFRCGMRYFLAFGALGSRRISAYFANRSSSASRKSADCGMRVLADNSCIVARISGVMLMPSCTCFSRCAISVSIPWLW